MSRNRYFESHAVCWGPVLSLLPEHPLQRSLHVSTFSLPHFLPLMVTWQIGFALHAIVISVHCKGNALMEAVEGLFVTKTVLYM